MDTKNIRDLIAKVQEKGRGAIIGGGLTSILNAICDELENVTPAEEPICVPAESVEQEGNVYFIGLTSNDKQTVKQALLGGKPVCVAFNNLGAEYRIFVKGGRALNEADAAAYADMNGNSYVISL